MPRFCFLGTLLVLLASACGAAAPPGLAADTHDNITLTLLDVSQSPSALVVHSRLDVRAPWYGRSPDGVALAVVVASSQVWDDQGSALPAVKTTVARCEQALRVDGVSFDCVMEFAAVPAGARRLTLSTAVELRDVPVEETITLDLAGRQFDEAWDPGCSVRVAGLEVDFTSARLALDTRRYGDRALREIVVHLTARPCPADRLRLTAVHVFQNGLRFSEECRPAAEGAFTSVALVGPAPASRGRLAVPGGTVPFQVTADLAFIEPWEVSWPLAGAPAD
jgi:hypothetical protein